MFRDHIKLKLKAGDGGNGKVAFGYNHLPTGGIGGSGGNLFFEGDENIYDLYRLTPDQLYSAERGENGGLKNLTGKDGKDLILKVPLSTKIYTKTNELLLSIDQHGQKVAICKGGIGGLGNAYYKRGGIKTAKKFQVGKPGEEINVTLELELQNDVLFIGLPNAGKSSILNELTAADSKVAAYPFTTLIPHLGRMGKYVLMDLPGLIENASEGKGLGTDFVKHTKSSKLLAHFVNLESNDPIKDYNIIRKELANIDKDLASKSEIIILTKTDLIDQTKLPKIIALFKKYKRTVATVSTYDFDALEDLKRLIIDYLK